MSRPSQYILLCEDKLHGVFVKRFLKKNGVTRNQIREIPCPNGKKAGEQHVRNQYPIELKLCRQRNTKASTLLIVVVDADLGLVEEHDRELDEAARKEDISPRTSSDKVVHIIPKRNIETWFAFLDPERGSEEKAIDEEKDYKGRKNYSNRESDCHSLVDLLCESCKKHQLLPNAPPSLLRACEEFSRIHSLLTR
ncbi:MAG: hypothetical protein ACRC10_08665 [Thermoguttaceae bacterium]